MDKNRYEYFLQNHKPLKFGTSGLRDEDSKLTDMQIYISTKGFLNYLFLNGMMNKGNRVAIAGDFRPSTPKLLFAVAFGIIDSGFNVEYCGKVPTPTVSHFGILNKIPSIMVTASHNPYGQNGVKFVRPDREILKDEENSILFEISKVREEEYNKSWEESLFTDGGSFKRFEDLNPAFQFLYYLAKKSLKKENKLAKEAYINRYKRAFGKVLQGTRLVFYEQSSVGRDIIPNILEELGAEVIRVGRVDETKEFISLDTEDMKGYILDKMACFAIENNTFTTITADGDCDRPAILFIRKDQNGKYKYKDGKPHFHHIMGDKLNILISILLKADFVAVPIHADYKGVELMKKNGIEVKITRVGAPHVIKAVFDKLRDEKNKNLFLYSFERNGGSIIGSSRILPEEFFGENSELAGLPTRDAVFPIICILALANKKGIDLEDLFNEVFSGEFESYSYSGLVENVLGNVTPGCERYTPEIGNNLIEAFLPKKKEVIDIVFDDGRIFCYDENKFKIQIDRETEFLIEKSMNILAGYIFEIIGKNVSFKSINYLDGIKIALSNDEAIHLRPSRNAAQFRVYAEAKNEERAKELVDKAIKPINGVLVKMINNFIDGRI